MSRVGLVELWDADYGMRFTSGGTFIQWTGRMGNVARPEWAGAGLALNTNILSNGRRALQFNGTSSGLRCSIPSLRRACGNVAVHVQLHPTVNTTALQGIVNITSDGSASRLYLNHPGTANYLRAEGVDAVVSATSTTGWAAGSEMVIGACRAIGSTLKLWKNGASLASVADSTTEVGLCGDVGIGFDGTLTALSWFTGYIRRIAIYVAVHDDAKAAAIDLQWRGY